MPLDVEVVLGPGDFVLGGGPAPPPQKGGGTPPHCRPMSSVAKRLSLLGGSCDYSNTTSPGPRFAYVPSGILIHPAVWLQ